MRLCKQRRRPRKGKGWVNTPRIAWGDDADMGTVDGKYSSPPSASPAAPNFNVVVRRVGALGTATSGVALDLNVEMGARGGGAGSGGGGRLIFRLPLAMLVSPTSARPSLASSVAQSRRSERTRGELGGRRQAAAR